MITITQNRNHQSYNSRGVLTYQYRTDITFENEEKYQKYKNYQYIIKKERDEEDNRREIERERDKKNYQPPKPKTNEEKFKDLPKWRQDKIREMLGM